MIYHAWVDVDMVFGPYAWLLIQDSVCHKPQQYELPAGTEKFSYTTKNGCLLIIFFTFVKKRSFYIVEGNGEGLSSPYGSNSESKVVYTWEGR